MKLETIVSYKTVYQAQKFTSKTISMQVNQHLGLIFIFFISQMQARCRDGNIEIAVSWKWNHFFRNFARPQTHERKSHFLNYIKNMKNMKKWNQFNFDIKNWHCTVNTVRFAEGLFSLYGGWCLTVCLFVCLSVCLTVRLFVCLSFRTNEREQFFIIL